MMNFLQATACVLIAMILTLVLRGHGKDMALMLTILVCCMLGILAFAYFQPVIEFVEHLRQSAVLDNAMLSVLWKVVGTSLLAEIAATVCLDAGNASVGKMLQFLAVGVILWLSLPMLTALLDLVEEILFQV